jgi:flagella basal body P-ring formation protein FlgA
LLAAALTGVQALREAAELESGRPVLMDPRITVPPCATPPAFEPVGDRALMARCPASGWSLLLPFASPGVSRPAPPLVRRGDPVRVRLKGAGYEVRIEGVAMANGSAGARVRVKLPQGNQLLAEIDQDGGLTLAGQP